jgi:hypothetical protein
MARAFDEGMHRRIAMPTRGAKRTIERIWSITLLWISPSYYHHCGWFYRPNKEDSPLRWLPSGGNQDLRESATILATCTFLRPLSQTDRSGRLALQRDFCLEGEKQWDLYSWPAAGASGMPAVR